MCLLHTGCHSALAYVHRASMVLALSIEIFIYDKRTSLGNMCSLLYASQLLTTLTSF